MSIDNSWITPTMVGSLPYCSMEKKVLQIYFHFLEIYEFVVKKRVTHNTSKALSLYYLSNFVMQVHS
jgi:hypothetical protein